jgi:hypothetical protein
MWWKPRASESVGASSPERGGSTSSTSVGADVCGRRSDGDHISAERWRRSTVFAVKTLRQKNGRGGRIFVVAVHG